jgi:hypothetical protein
MARSIILHFGITGVLLVQWKVMVVEVCGRLPEAGITLLCQTTICFIFILPNPLKYRKSEKDCTLFYFFSP